MISEDKSEIASETTWWELFGERSWLVKGFADSWGFVKWFDLVPKNGL